GGCHPIAVPFYSDVRKHAAAVRRVEARPFEWQPLAIGQAEAILVRAARPDPGAVPAIDPDDVETAIRQQVEVDARTAAERQYAGPPDAGEQAFERRDQVTPRQPIVALFLVERLGLAEVVVEPAADDQIGEAVPVFEGHTAAAAGDLLRGELQL